MEIWKDIEGYEGHYQVSTDGRVRSLDREVNHKRTGVAFWRGVEISQRMHKGYRTVTLNLDGVKKTIAVHRLLAKAHIPNPENKTCINHKNGLRSDNRIENLEWATHSDNLHHAYRTGLRKMYKGKEVKVSWLSQQEKNNLINRRNKLKTQKS